MAETQPILANAAPQLTDDYREIYGFPGYYLRRDGTVWTGWNGTLKPMATRRNQSGYVCLNIRNKSIGNHLGLLSRAMLEAFVGPAPHERSEACHDDGNFLNNRLDNLRWDTKAGNEADKIRHGTTNRGERNGMATIGVGLVLEVRRMYELAKKGRRKVPPGTIPDICKKTGLGSSCVIQIVNRQTWKHV